MIFKLNPRLNIKEITTIQIPFYLLILILHQIYHQIAQKIQQILLINVQKLQNQFPIIVKMLQNIRILLFLIAMSRDPLQNLINILHLLHIRKQHMHQQPSTIKQISNPKTQFIKTPTLIIFIHLFSIHKENPSSSFKLNIVNIVNIYRLLIDSFPCIMLRSTLRTISSLIKTPTITNKNNLLTLTLIPSN